MYKQITTTMYEFENFFLDNKKKHNLLPKKTKKAAVKMFHSYDLIQENQ